MVTMKDRTATLRRPPPARRSYKRWSLVLGFILSIVVLLQRSDHLSDYYYLVETTSPFKPTGIPNPRFVTVLLFSDALNPLERPLRLRAIAETWGPSANAIFVVPHNHNASELAILDGSVPPLYLNHHNNEESKTTRKRRLKPTRNNLHRHLLRHHHLRSRNRKHSLS